jgi:hypothetical protein
LTLNFDPYMNGTFPSHSFALARPILLVLAGSANGVAQYFQANTEASWEVEQNL